VCRFDVILHVNLKYSETLGGLDPVAPSIESLGGKGRPSPFGHATPVKTEPTDRVQRDSRRQWSILGYGEAAIGVCLRNGLPALAHGSEVATPSLDLVFTSGSIDESMEVVGVARGLHRRVVDDFVEYLVPDLDWEGWQHRDHSSRGLCGGTGGRWIGLFGCDREMRGMKSRQ